MKHMIPSHPRCPNKTSGFTLIELIVAITILMVVMVSVFLAYSQIIDLNRKLEISRILQENTRNSTEMIAQAIREYGIDFAFFNGSSLEKTNHYTGSGNLILPIKGFGKFMPMKINAAGGLEMCYESDFQNPDTKCSIGFEDAALNQRRFITDERIRLRSLKFYISGDAINTVDVSKREAKVLVHFEIELSNRSGMTEAIRKKSMLTVQTTISEKVYKSLTP